MDEVINKLKSANKDVKVHKGKVHSYLGLQFDFSDTDKVCISSSGIISEILQEYQVTGVAVTPVNLICSQFVRKVFFWIHSARAVTRSCSFRCFVAFHYFSFPLAAQACF